MTKWTPGPWRIVTTGNLGNGIEAHIGPGTLEPNLDTGWRPVALYMACGHFHNDAFAEEANRKANAHLIAAAPELYEALERLLNVCVGQTQVPDSTVDDAEAALRKARGDA